jgi:Fur family ferric uptake transcriptional regulator
VLEFCDPRIGEIQELLGKIHGMEIESHSLHFYGTCKNTEECEARQKENLEKENAEA